MIDESRRIVSRWGWANKDSLIRKVISMDKRDPTLYANGKVYGADRTGGGIVWALDPLKNPSKKYRWSLESHRG
jgi:hypothetical protein